MIALTFMEAAQPYLQKISAPLTDFDRLEGEGQASEITVPRVTERLKANGS
jgi:hypothetical protein